MNADGPGAALGSALVLLAAGAIAYGWYQFGEWWQRRNWRAHRATVERVEVSNVRVIH